MVDFRHYRYQPTDFRSAVKNLVHNGAPGYGASEVAPADCRSLTRRTISSAISAGLHRRFVRIADITMKGL
jgi:hypothetical protein